MSLGPPRPTIGPPSKGTTGSAVPWTAMHRDRSRRVARHARAQRSGHRRDRGDQVGAITRQAVGHEGTGRHPGDEDPSRRDGEVTGELADQGGQEADVVDALAVGHRRAAAVGPAHVDAVGVGDDEAVLVGDGVVVGDGGLLGAGLSGAVQVDDQAGRCSRPGGTCRT